MVKDCGKRSDRESDKDVSFHRLPAESDYRGEKDYELQKRRRAGWLAVVSRKDLDYNDLTKYRIRSTHFESGKPVSLYDTWMANNLAHWS